MPDLTAKDYIVIVQCHIVKERCSGYFCEKAFHERTGGFSGDPTDKQYRVLFMSCGGCCGRALHRKLSNLATQIRKRESIEKGRLLVQLSSCIVNDNYHGPPCPHLDYLKQLIARVGLDVREGTSISPKAEARRQEGKYAARPTTPAPAGP